ncbi:MULTISPECIES: hypothetical protein [unclassified Sphingomonas]|uniref:hypothetical protein n=1 Tax=unclassified Sphingomonas TaxID=196159 RepID=UPI0008295FEA|nr:MULTISPECIES: hypothetical protein [unclassified Sphingomonas]
MNALLTKLGLGTALAATTLAVAAPAEARRYYRDRDDAAAAAAIAGIAGIAIGAAIASDRDRYYDDDYYYYDRPGPRFYGPRYVYPRRGYWGPPRRYYDDCRVRRVYDPYLGRRVRVRYC